MVAAMIGITCDLRRFRSIVDLLSGWNIKLDVFTVFWISIGGECRAGAMLLLALPEESSGM